jgi:hypothetical protein
MQSKLPNRISYDTLQDKLKALEIKKNRVSAQLNIENRKNLSSANIDRKKRTRTLIQLGSLIKLSGLMEICEIEEGNDLQSRIEDADKAATLLGVLITCVENMRDELDESVLEVFKQKGIRTLKMNSYSKI